MMVTQINKERIAQWQPFAGMPGVMCSIQSASIINLFDGLSQQLTQAKDSHIRH